MIKRLKAPSSPKPAAAQKISDAAGPKEASTPKESNTPKAARNAVVAGVAEANLAVNGHAEKSLDAVQDNKTRITLDRGGRGESFFLWRLRCLVGTF